MNSAVIIGAGSAIGRQLVEQYTADPGVEAVWAIARKIEPGVSGGGKVRWLESDYSEASMADCTQTMRAAKCRPGYVFICLGILHEEGLQPEKRIEDLQLDSLQRVLSVNAFLPALWLRNLLPVIHHDATCRVAVFSARVGSIGDNRLGGWYAYRASKAALNMLLKTAAIEFARRAKRVKLVAFHPGTTDTPLSRPFQGNVPAGKLFTPEEVAARLIALLEGIEIDGSLSYLDWDGKQVPW